MVTPGFGVTHVAESTFLSVFTLPAEKWSSMQGQLHNFFEGNLSPICASSRPPSRGITNPAPKRPNDDPMVGEDQADAPSAHLVESPPVIGHGIGGKYIPIMARLAKARRWSKR